MMVDSFSSATGVRIINKQTDKAYDTRVIYNLAFINVAHALASTNFVPHTGCCIHLVF